MLHASRMGPIYTRAGTIRRARLARPRFVNNVVPGSVKSGTNSVALARRYSRIESSVARSHFVFFPPFFFNESITLINRRGNV